MPHSESDPTSTIFSLMIATESSRDTFISSVQSTLSTYQLDGLGEHNQDLTSTLNTDVNMHAVDIDFG